MGRLMHCHILARHQSVLIPSLRRAFQVDVSHGQLRPEPSSMPTVFEAGQPIPFTFQLMRTPQSTQSPVQVRIGLTSPPIHLSTPELVLAQPEANDFIGLSKQLLFSGRVARAGEILAMHCSGLRCGTAGLLLFAQVQTVRFRWRGSHRV